MTRSELMHKFFRGEDVPEFPSQIDFTPSALQKLLNKKNWTEPQLEGEIGNYITYAYSWGNVEEYMHDLDLLQQGEALGFARYDREAEIVYDCFGVGWDRTCEGVYACIHPLAGSEDLTGYRFPTPAPNILERAMATVQAHQGSCFVMGFQHIGLFERAWMLRGYENFLTDLYLNPGYAEAILDGILEYKIQEALLYVESGVDCVRTGDDWGTQQNLAISPALWRKFIKPRQAKLWEVYKNAGMPVVHHSCGNIMEIIPDLLEIGLDCLHPVQPLAMDIRHLSEKYGKQLIFFGGIDTQRLLCREKPDKIRRTIDELSAIFAPARGWIIAPSQEVMSDVPEENISALIEAVAEARQTTAERHRA